MFISSRFFWLQLFRAWRTETTSRTSVRVSTPAEVDVAMDAAYPEVSPLRSDLGNLTFRDASARGSVRLYSFAHPEIRPSTRDTMCEASWFLLFMAAAVLSRSARV